MATSHVNDSAEKLLIGESQAMVELRRLVRQVAPTTASVLITGPSGSGKEVVARAIHGESKRFSHSYVAVNCGAIPRELLESELFGHEKGSFTGAVAQKRGRFEDAHEGTLFLDEIGDMPADMQVKLLRVLEERRIQRVGGRGEIPVDARIISATHRDIESAIQDQRFREDLFYRLAVFPIDVPSLEDRAEDIPLLAQHFLTLNGSDVTFNGAALQALCEHRWPGNVRELRNAIDRAAILFAGQTVGAEQVEMVIHPNRRSAKPVRRSNVTPLKVVTTNGQPAEKPVSEAEVKIAAAATADQPPKLGEGPIDLRKLISDLEYSYVAEALRLSEGVVADAARLLSLQRTTLIEKMRKHGLAKAA